MGQLSNVILFGFVLVCLRSLRLGHIQFSNIRKGLGTALHHSQQRRPFASLRTMGRDVAQILPQKKEIMKTKAGGGILVGQHGGCHLLLDSGAQK